MRRKISRDLDAAFSLLPKAAAREAKERVLKSYGDGREAFSLELKWSEHRSDGGFLRGGVTDMATHATRLVTNSQEDRDIHELASRARGHPALAGALTLLPQGDRFAWYLPFTPSKPDERSEPRVRGLMVTEAIFRDVLDLMRPEQPFTDAERRVLFQVTAGLTLREAAERDGVSFETKRAHTKSASSKMYCSGQKDLVRTLLGQLVHLLSVSEGEAAHAAPAETFVARYLSDDADLVVRRLPNGRLLRLLECGPASGRPLVMMHGMMFPITLVGASWHLDSVGIRLIIPIRTGFLEPRAPAELAVQGGFIAEAFSDLALYLEHEWREPAPILGQSLGGVLAIRFANLYPHLVSRLILQSINFTHGTDADGSRANSSTAA